MGFSRQEYWSGLPFTTPRDLPHPGIEPMPLVSPALAGRLFITQPPRKPLLNTGLTKKFVQVFHSITWTTLTRQILCATDNKKQRVLILEGRESAACIPSVNLCFLAVTQDRASGIRSLWKSLLVPQPRLIKAQSCSRVKIPRVWKAGRTLTAWLPLGLGHLERG